MLRSERVTGSQVCRLSVDDVAERAEAGYVQDPAHRTVRTHETDGPASPHCDLAQVTQRHQPRRVHEVDLLKVDLDVNGTAAAEVGDQNEQLVLRTRSTSPWRTIRKESPV